MVFSDSSTNLGIVERSRILMRADSTQWPTSRIVGSANDYLDCCVGYLIGADRRFQWDDTNHTKLPEGTCTMTAAQTDYSFLTDEQGNTIITLTGVSILQNGVYAPLTLVDRNDPGLDLTNFGALTGTPTQYDKIADNIIRLNYKPSATVSVGLKFFFQRTPSYFAASDTTKSPGVAPILHRGFVIAAAYDGALAMGLPNLNALSVEKQREEQKMIAYFGDRNRDDYSGMGANVEDMR